MSAKPQRRLEGADFTGEEVCRSCGTAISAGAGRGILTLLELHQRSVNYAESLYRMERKGFVPFSDELKTTPGGVFFYCVVCAGKISQFTADNPWLRERCTATDGPPPDRKPRWIAGTRPQFEQEGQARSAAAEASLEKAVAAGNMAAFDAAMPTSPKSGDMMAHAASLDSLAANDGRSVDEFMGAHISSSAAPGGSSSNAEAMRRDKLRRFLDSTHSRGRLGQTAREAAKRWVRGETQAEIAFPAGSRFFPIQRPQPWLRCSVVRTT